MALAAGKLRQYVEIQQPVTPRNADGERTESWIHFSYCWANIEPLSAREFMTAQQIQSKISARITIRKQTGLTADMRVRYGTDYYNIEGILPDPVSGKEYITLPCSTGIVDPAETVSILSGGVPGSDPGSILSGGAP